MSARRVKKAEISLVALYVRVSTVEQAEKDLSLPAQLDALRRFCKERDYTIVHEYVEPGVSGTDDNRKVFKRMMDDLLAPSNKVDAVLVLHSSRFMRNAERARFHKTALRKQGVRVVAIRQETNDDPSGHLMEGMFELFDQYESEVNGMRTSAAMRENAKQGYFNGSAAPFGYAAEKVPGRSGQTKRTLVPCPAEVPLHNEVFRTYVHREGAKSTARDLNQRGYRYRKGKLWSRDLVLKVLEETAAIGTYYWGKHDPKTGRLLDEEDWVAIKVEPIISPELFEMAQRIRDSHDPRKSPGRTGSSPMMLAGLVKCGKCGASYQLETSGKKNADGASPHRYYNCRSTIRTGREACAGFRLPMKVLDQAVLRHTAEQLFSVEKCRAILKDLVEETGILRQKTAEHRHKLQRELEEIERRIRRWQEAFEAGELPSDLGTERIRELQAKRDELAGTLAKIIPLRQPPPYLYGDKVLGRFQEKMRELFIGADNALTRHYLRFLLDEVVVTDNHVEIVARSEAALRMLAAAGDPVPGGEVAHQDGVLTSVVPWLPSTFGSPKLLSTLLWTCDRTRKRRDPAPLERPHVVKLLMLAEEFQAKLDRGEVNHQADLARFYVMSRARVTQLLDLLKLHPEIRRFVHSLGQGVAQRYVTERRLRPLCSLEWRDQLREFARLFPALHHEPSARSRTNRNGSASGA